MQGTTGKSFRTAASNRITDIKITSGSSALSESIGKHETVLWNFTHSTENLKEFLGNRDTSLGSEGANATLR